MQVYNIRAEFIPVNFDIPAKLVEKTIQANGVYNATSDDADGYSSVTVVVPDRELNIQELDITPSTSSQSFPIPAGVDGFGPVNVSGVVNVLPENIKEGVEILGVQGSVIELNGSTTTITPSTQAQTVSPTSPSNGFTSVTVPAVTASIDVNIQASNIKSGVTILGTTGNVVELDGETTTVTPTTSQQTITPTSPHNGLTSVTVDAVTSSIDPNIMPENIRDNVTILGTTGTYSGPAHYIEKTLDKSNSLINGATSIIDLPEKVGSNLATGEGYYVLAYAYYGNKNLTGTIDLSNVKYLMGNGTCEYMVSRCPYITGINLSNLESMIGLGSAIFDSFARQCTALTSVNIDKFYQVSGGNIFDYSFYGCTALTSFKFTSLKVFYGSNNLVQLFNYTFSGSGIQDIYFPAVKESTFYMPNSTTLYSNCINNIIKGVTGCTLHFPKNLDPAGGSTVLSSLNGYPNFGGTNTVLAFDQPSTVILTGANSQAYERSPKDDTATALAWRKQDVGTPQQGFTVDWTPFYTNGTTDPQVGDTIYSDSACTQTVTTIGAIA